MFKAGGKLLHHIGVMGITVLTMEDLDLIASLSILGVRHQMLSGHLNVGYLTETLNVDCTFSIAFVSNVSHVRNKSSLWASDPFDIPMFLTY